MRNKRLLVSCLLLILIVACTPSADTSTAPTNTPETPEIGGEPTPTVPAPSYQEPSEPVTIKNAPQIAYLGRLDAPGTPSTVFSHAFSPDGTRLALLNNDLIMDWDLARGELVFSRSRSGALRVLYSADKNELYAITGEGDVTVLSTEGGSILNDFAGHEAFNSQVAYFPDEGWLAMSGTDGTVKVWDTLERVSLVTFFVNEVPITALDFTSDGTQLAVATQDGTVSIWEWQTETRIATFDLEGPFASEIAFAPDGSQLATATGNFIAMWDLESQDLDYVLQTGEGGTSELLQFSPDGRLLVHAGRSNPMTIWKTENASPLGTLPGLAGDRLSADFSLDGNLLVTSVRGTDMSLWNLSEVSDAGIVRANLDVGTNNIFAVDWADDGYTLAIFDAGGPVYIWGIPRNES